MARSVHHKVDTDELDCGFHVVCNQEEIFKSKCNDLMNQTDELNSNWSGMDYDTFKESVHKMESPLKDMQTVLRGLENDLYWAKAEYEQAFSEVSSMMSGFSV